MPILIPGYHGNRISGPLQSGVDEAVEDGDEDDEKDDIKESEPGHSKLSRGMECNKYNNTIYAS